MQNNPNLRPSIEELRKILRAESYNLISETSLIKNRDTEIEVECPNHHKWNLRWGYWTQGYRCPYWKMKDSNEVSSLLKKLNFKVIKEKPRTKMRVACLKGHEFDFNFYSKSPKKCKYCDLEEILENLKKEGYSLLDDISENKKVITQKIRFVCPEGHLWEPRLSDVKYGGNRCNTCYGSKKLEISEVKELLEKEGYTLVSEKYVNVEEKLEMVCPKGHLHKNNIKEWKRGTRCGVCYGSHKKRLVDLESEAFKEGYSLLNKENYNDSNFNIKTDVFLKCPNNHTFESSWVKWDNNKSRCPFCNLSGISKQEIDLKEELSKFKIPFIHQDNKIIKPKEIDFYFESKKLGIEYCGLYWHSKKNPSDHKNKMNICNNLGIELITIFSDEWLFKRDIVLSRIKSKLGIINKIFARKTEIAEISDTNLVNDFLEKNHIQGKGSYSKAWGLFLNKDLVAVMTVGALNRKHASKGKKVLELKRYCSKLDYAVVGGASKLFSKVIIYAKNNNFEIIKSYCDLRWGNGNLYKNLGFKCIRVGKHTPHYFKRDKRYRNFSLRKTQSERDSNKTEKELRKEQGYSIIYDCGHQTWDFEVSP